MLNQDYKEMLQLLLEHKAKFLVIGAYAMGVHGYPRATADIDIWVEASVENSKRVYMAIKDFGAPLYDIDEMTFSQKDAIFQIGIAPRRIDILSEIEGIEFGEAYDKRIEVELEDLTIPFISREFLIKSKSATGRDRDRIDVENLLRDKTK